MNIKIFHLLNNLAGQNKIFDGFVVFFASAFGYILILAAIIFLFLHLSKDEAKFSDWKKFIFKSREISIVFLTSFFAWIVTAIIKNIALAPRPQTLLQNIHVLTKDIGYDSFPSGHATFFSALAAIIFLYHPRTGIYFGIGALLIGFSRIVAGIHFPIDILAGYILGIGISIFIYELFGYKKGAVDSFLKKG